MATFLTPDQPIFLTPRERQVAELLDTRRRQIEEAEEHDRLLGDYGWAARALIRTQVLASGRSQASGDWRKQAVSDQRVWRDLCSKNPLVNDPEDPLNLVALSAVQDALAELSRRGLAQLQRKRARDSPSLYVWGVPWLP